MIRTYVPLFACLVLFVWASNLEEISLYKAGPRIFDPQRPDSRKCIWIIKVKNASVDSRKNFSTKCRMFSLKCGVVLWEVISMKQLIDSFINFNLNRKWNWLNYLFTFSFRPEGIVFVQDDTFMIFPFLEGINK